MGVLTFGYVPNEDVHYTVKHIDNPSKIRADFYRQRSGGEEQKFDVDDIDICQPDSM
jgi:hypothetical protein